MDKRDSFVFFRSFLDTIEVINDKNVQLDVLMAIIRYGLNGEEHENDSEIAKVVLAAVKLQIDKSKKRYDASVENGKMGGRPKKNKNLEKPRKTQNNQTKPTSNLYDDDNDNDNDDDDDDDKNTHPLTGVCANSSSFARPHPFFSDKDLEEIRNLWNEKISNYPSVTKLDCKNRKRKMIICLQRLCNVYPDSDKEGIIELLMFYFEKINASEFLLNDYKGKVTFDWFFDEKNFIKVIEGDYDNK